MSNMRPVSKEYVINVDDVAALLGIHRHTVKRLDPADLPYFRVGTRGDRRYRVVDVERYIKERTVG